MDRLDCSNGSEHCKVQRVSYHHGNLAVALVDAAEQLVREQGAYSWSVREAARRAGVTPGAAYHHFADREALVRALAARHFERLTDEMQARRRRAGDAPGEGATAYSLAYVMWARRDPGLFDIAFGSAREYRGDPLAVEAFALLREELSREGYDRDVAPTSVWAAAHGVASLTAAGPLKHWDDKGVTDLTVAMVARVLAGIRDENAIVR